MFIDTADIQPNAELTAELCIVGAGAAGIAMAKALIRSGIDVLLLEGGGRKKTKASQAIYRGKMQAGLKSTFFPVVFDIADSRSMPLSLRETSISVVL